MESWIVGDVVQGSNNAYLVPNPTVTMEAIVR